MHAILLAAGVGQRLKQRHSGAKCLLEIGGRSLLARHCENLIALGVDNLTVCAGHDADSLLAALAACRAPRTLVHYNPLYTLGSSVSLWSARHTLACGDDVLVMDADVLYHPDILRRLVHSPRRNCFLLDRDFVPGDEPVKLCLDGTRIVEFRKRVAAGLAYTAIGESVGFFKFEPATALALLRVLESYVAGGRREQPHEEALRDLALASHADIGVEDVTGLPWIEIDFPEDVARATDHILPRLHAA